MFSRVKYRAFCPFEPKLKNWALQNYSCVSITQAGCNKWEGVLNVLNRAFLPARFYVVKMAKQAGKSSKIFCCEHARVLGTPE